MAENIPNISEIYTAKEKLSLTENFDTFAKSKGLSEKAIQTTKGEIQKLFDNSGKLTQTFLSTVNTKIENIIRAELSADLAIKSKAMKGIPIDSLAEKIETTPNPTTKVVDASIKGAVMGGFEKTLKERGNMINAAAGS